MSGAQTTTERTQTAATETAKQEEAVKAAEAAAREAETKRQSEQERAAKEASRPQPIHFDFDRSDIREDAKAVLKATAEWLRSRPTATVRIEGSCDERGTIEYNQALGQRRAQSAKRYLVGLGVSPSRITLLSYGKEKPVCREATEECWQKNRRGDFVVTPE